MGRTNGETRGSYPGMDWHLGDLEHNLPLPQKDLLRHKLGVQRRHQLRKIHGNGTITLVPQPHPKWGLVKVGGGRY